MPRQIRPVVLPAFLLMLAACGSPTGPVVPDAPYETAGAVLDSLEAAYNGMDLELYLAGFRDDFQFHLLEVDFNDYDGDGIVDSLWGPDLEDLFHQAMFSQVAGISLTLEGSEESPWSADTTGASLLLPRTFDLMVYIDPAHSMGYHASGEAMFICRQDSLGAWYVWQWTDVSDIGGWRSSSGPLEASSWGSIKGTFGT